MAGPTTASSISSLIASGTGRSRTISASTPDSPRASSSSENFTFSTSPRILPISTQTRDKEPGGVDRAGSLGSGAVVPGLLGDDDGEGRLAGTFNAIGSFPLDSVLLPGAPFAQTRVFQTDIPVSSELAGFLTLANAISFLRAAVAWQPTETDADVTLLSRGFRDRLTLAAKHFARADTWLRSLDDEAAAAYVRLTVPPEDLNDRRLDPAQYVAIDGDLAVLGAGLSCAQRQGRIAAGRRW